MIAKFLNSLEAILIPMLILLIAFIVDAGVLFYRVLPEYMNENLKLFASIMLGIAVAFPLLLTSVNSNLLKHKYKVGFPEIFGFCSFFMTLLFFDVFSAEIKPLNWYLTTVFMCLLLGLIDYLYADLFVKKYNQIYNLELQQQDYEKLKDENESILKDLDKSDLVLQQSKEELSKTKESLQRTISSLEEANEKLTCPHCGQLQKSVSAYRNHIGNCKENPKNKLNGKIKSISITKES
ncbi:hypothetical protein U6A24_02630 [Aquimarina gracilis]|uniref:Uncharacterized protein n=1 Tax=Aquimarina gracilis TaxID=874422 RepID=A0ABU5ZQI8_9FLAO|nr:hypothetical protein [Aquimarina gracilis]MEB3344336.1 hypothetical protein [Aquimarina gracilis]